MDEAGEIGTCTRSAEKIRLVEQDGERVAAVRRTDAEGFQFLAGYQHARGIGGLAEGFFQLRVADELEGGLHAGGGSARRHLVLPQLGDLALDNTVRRLPQVAARSPDRFRRHGSLGWRAGWQVVAHHIGVAASLAIRRSPASTQLVRSRRPSSVAPHS